MLILILSLFLLGTVAISLEASLPGGILGVAGAILVTLAIILTLSSDAFSSTRSKLAITATITSVAVVSAKVSRAHIRQRPLHRLLSLEDAAGSPPAGSEKPFEIGQYATTTTDLFPRGRIADEERSTYAESASGLIRSGTRVRIFRIDAGTLYVVRS